ncbi:hypothetical protein Scep_023869 [Stephania cephalantha]|uniref:Uncharacterized protein n=1 Tax=Stephania cephalantha TaxID=152367 RepID=A0AAP0HXU8_9MAGN
MGVIRNLTSEPAMNQPCISLRRNSEEEEREAEDTEVVQRREARAAEEGLADCGMDDGSVGSEDDRTTTFDARGDEDEWLEERVDDLQIGNGTLTDATPLEVIAEREWGNSTTYGLTG